ncbi:unnamed protein product [Trichobilharzia regenti]|nr:unnamed protein product [Trichobilharzia regenti]
MLTHKSLSFPVGSFCSLDYFVYLHYFLVSLLQRYNYL